jgi:hypothetical protein
MHFGEMAGILFLAGIEEEAGILADEFVLGETELGDDEV